jgi:hypothetical protein
VCLPSCNVAPPLNQCSFIENLIKIIVYLCSVHVDREMHERLVRLLTVNLPQLVDEIDLEREPGILNLLLSHNVLSKRQAKSISVRFFILLIFVV